MAEFCADCTVEIMGVARELNDFKGTGIRWALCEGCGMHAFDGVTGERMCGDVDYRRSLPCPSCNATLDLLAEHPRTGAGRGIADVQLRPGHL